MSRERHYSKLHMSDTAQDRHRYSGILMVTYALSQYSTVVLTVVRVMIAKYRKSGIWGYRSSLTPEPIELK